MTELSNFNSDGINDLTLVVEQPHRNRLLKFKCVYDSDKDEDFNLSENEKFRFT